MVVNLCLPHFQTTVQCNKLCADGYNVSNLLSVDPVVKRRGCKLEYFLRPPLHVTLWFGFRVELCRVDMELWSGGMDQGNSSRRLEILTCSDCPPQTPRQEQRPDCGHFKLVGRSELREEVHVCFCHPNFQRRAPFPEPPPDPTTGAKLVELWSRGPHSLNSVSHLRVSIPYGGGATPLGIKSLSVWGLPARNCPSQELERIKEAHHSSLRPNPPSAVLTLPVAEEPKPLAPDLVPTDQPIPQEFLDPLTQELMVLPMILPSGMVVDISTLEEYQQREATWGRPPNDPFTAVPFTKDSKPLPNPLLKSRIDSFALRTGCTGAKHRNGLQTEPQPSRLIGSSSAAELCSSSDPMRPHSVAGGPGSNPRTAGCCSRGGSERTQRSMDASVTVQSGPTGSDGQENRSKPAAGLDSASADVGAVRRKRALCVPHRESGSGSGSSDPHLSSGPSNSTVSAPTRSSAGSPLTKKPRTDGVHMCSIDSSEASHEQRLMDSLDQALSSALFGLPTFTSQSKPETATSNTTTGGNTCGLCLCSLTVYPTSPPAYSLPCGHLLCRPCLHKQSPVNSQTAQTVCPTCKRSSPSRAITRVHH